MNHYEKTNSYTFCLFLESFQKRTNQCKCPFACESVEYIPTLSYAPYPSDLEARETAIKELERENKNQTEENIKERIVSLRFDILFQVFLEEILHKKPTSQ